MKCIQCNSKHKKKQGTFATEPQDEDGSEENKEHLPLVEIAFPSHRPSSTITTTAAFSQW